MDPLPAHARCWTDGWAHRGLGLGLGTLGQEGSGEMVTFSNLQHDSPKAQPSIDTSTVIRLDQPPEQRPLRMLLWVVSPKKIR